MPPSNIQHSPLADLDFIPYINANGELPTQFAGKVGVYAIFNDAKALQYVGYSRDVILSLRQHLVRSPDQCGWVKVATIDRPSRSILEEIRQAWIAENGEVPVGNGDRAAQWTQPIDVKPLITSDEHNALANAAGDLERTKLLKAIARRVEADIKNQLHQRGLTENIRFDPKLKEQGLLNVKP